MEKNERKYKNQEISVYWKPSKCIHASVCYSRLLEVFNPIKRPWINLDGASVDKIIDVVNHCPTEALTWMWNDPEKNNEITERDTNHVFNRRPGLLGNVDETPEEPHPVSIKIMKNGPIVVEGNITIIYPDGREQTVDEFTSFCRCGASRNIPFCDGSHRKVGFSDEE